MQGATGRGRNTARRAIIVASLVLGACLSGPARLLVPVDRPVCAPAESPTPIGAQASPELPRPVKGCEGAEVRLVDLDGDGRDEVLASFAGEPTGPAGLPGVIGFPGFPGQGRIYAWRATPATTDPAAADPATAGR